MNSVSIKFELITHSYVFNVWHFAVAVECRYDAHDISLLENVTFVLYLVKVYFYF